MSTAIAQPSSSSVATATSDRVELSIRPPERASLVIGFRALVVCAIFALFCLVLLAGGGPNPILILLPVGAVLSVLLVASIILMVQRFELTESRVRASRGVFSRTTVEARLDHVRNITVTRSFLERLLALGTIRMTTAGVGPEVVWRHVARPAPLADRLRRSIDGVHLPGGQPSTPAPIAPIQTPVSSTPQPSSRTTRLPVIGLAGGIGAGKSTVARAFERLGCHVIDSDARAKAALDRPEVRDALVQWWGAQVLSSDGRVDRAQVARIIFSDPAERNRLEQLVHPLVREDRARMIQEARAAGARAVIVDAPLLFEAGVDAECDVVVFVDAPREQRVDRIRQTRGWDDAELERREAAQISLEEKRSRSQYVIENRGDPRDLEGQVEEILASVEIGPDSADPSVSR